MGRGLPTSFVPTEDQGYFFLNYSCPPAASLQRTDEVGRKVEKILAKTEGVRTSPTRGLQPADPGLGLLQRLRLRRPEALGRAQGARARGRPSCARLNARFAREIPDANVFGSLPPAIPGLGTSSGFSAVAPGPQRRRAAHTWRRNADRRSWPRPASGPSSAASPRSFRTSAPQIYRTWTGTRPSSRACRWATSS